jgi:hypothetical protein
MTHADLTPDDLPDGWAIGSNHDSHVSIVREGDTRHHIAAHPMADATGEPGWFALARPGTDKIVAEADPLTDVIEAMIEAARTHNNTEEYELARRGSVIEKYTADEDNSQNDDPQASLLDWES